MRPGRVPEGILWDWDNTLVDGWPAIAAGLNAAFTRFGLPEWTLEEVRGRVRRSLRESFPEIFGSDWERRATSSTPRSGRATWPC